MLYNGLLITILSLLTRLSVGDQGEIGYRINRTYDREYLDTGSALKGPIATMLHDISLRLQQHDQEQRLDTIQQLQLREVLLQSSQKQAELQRELLERIQQLQLNMSVEIERIGRQQRAMHLEAETEVHVVGCYKDAADRDLPHDVIVQSDMTHRQCAKHCFLKQYRYAAIQGGERCYCGNGYGRHGASSSCNVTCPGDKSGQTKCGGAWANTVLRTSQSKKDAGRILMQQHIGGTNFFSKTWVEFKSEFGDVEANYWIGNERLHELTKDGNYKLRVDMLAKSNNRWYWAEYNTFRVYDESSGFTLNVGGYTGSAGDSLAPVNGKMFSTKDKDQDMWTNNCAAESNNGNGGGFWYNHCSHAFPNSPPEGNWGFVWNGLPIGSGTSDRKLLITRMTLIPK